MRKNKAHAKYSASGASRWLNCAASPSLIAKSPPQIESRYAVEGTNAHAVLEALLKAKTPPDGRGFDLAMLEFAEIARDAILKAAPNGSTLLVETKADLSFIEPDTFGTLDAAIVEDFGRLTVIDYKYGAGVPVSPIENDQLSFYALALAHANHYNFQDVELMVIQPRAMGAENGGVKSWTTSIEYLIDWGNKAREAIKKTKTKNPEATPGDWCKFCAAATICPALSKNALDSAQVDFALDSGVVKTPDALGLTVSEISKILKAAPLIEAWLDAVKSRAYHTMETGGKIEGFKLVPKRAVRRWADPDQVTLEAGLAFGQNAFENKIKSPAQLEKIAGKSWVESRAVAVSSGLTLAPDSDSRKGTSQIIEDFGVYPEADMFGV